MTRGHAADAGRNVAGNGGTDLASLILSLWARRYWLAAGTAIAVLLGVLYTLLSTPSFHARAIIALKEGEKGGGSSAVLSQLGGFGGMMASQLGLGSTNLAKIDVILKGHDLARQVVTENRLLPKLFPDLWDSSAGRWVDSSEIPTIEDGMKALSKGALSVVVDEKRKLIVLGANSSVPSHAKDIVDAYLSALNRKLVSDVRNEATLNRDYLEEQLLKIHDPVLQEKISTMIAGEIEKHMLVSSRSFEVLESPDIPRERMKPKRKLIVALSFVIGLMATASAILAAPLVGKIRAGMSGN